MNSNRRRRSLKDTCKYMYLRFYSESFEFFREKLRNNQYHQLVSEEDKGFLANNHLMEFNLYGYILKKLYHNKEIIKSDILS